MRRDTSNNLLILFFLSCKKKKYHEVKNKNFLNKSITHIIEQQAKVGCNKGDFFTTKEASHDNYSSKYNFVQNMR